MWGNLRNVRSTMERLGNVVAPPNHDDEGSEDEYEEEEEEEYDEEEEEGEGDDEEYDSTSKGGSPFGFVGMLARALDKDQVKYDASHPSGREEEEDVVEEEELEEVYDFTTNEASSTVSSLQQQEQQQPGVHKTNLDDRFEMAAAEPMHPAASDLGDRGGAYYPSSVIPTSAPLDTTTPATAPALSSSPEARTNAVQQGFLHDDWDEEYTTVHLHEQQPEPPAFLQSSPSMESSANKVSSSAVTASSTVATSYAPETTTTEPQLEPQQTAAATPQPTEPARRASSTCISTHPDGNVSVIEPPQSPSIHQVERAVNVSSPPRSAGNMNGLPALIREKGSVSPAHHRLSHQLFLRQQNSSNSGGSPRQQGHDTLLGNHSHSFPQTTTLKLKSPGLEHGNSRPYFSDFDNIAAEQNNGKSLVLGKLSVPFPEDTNNEAASLSAEAKGFSDNHDNTTPSTLQRDHADHASWKPGNEKMTDSGSPPAMKLTTSSSSCTKKGDDDDDEAPPKVYRTTSPVVEQQPVSSRTSEESSQPPKVYPTISEVDKEQPQPEMASPRRMEEPLQTTETAPKVYKTISQVIDNKELQQQSVLASPRRKEESHERIRISGKGQHKPQPESCIVPRPKPDVSQTTTSVVDAKLERRAEKLEERCQQLPLQLERAENRVMELQQEHAVEEAAKQQRHTDQEQLYLQFQEKEARLLQAAAEDHQQEMMLLRGSLESQKVALQKQLSADQSVFTKERARLERQVADGQTRAERALQDLQKQQELAIADMRMRHERATSVEGDKLAQAMARLDEREEQMGQLQSRLAELQSSMAEHQEGAVEAEEEMDELHSENETLRHHVEDVEAECANLRSKIEELQADSEKLSVVKMELRILKEEKEREKAKTKSAVQSAATTTGQLEAEKDALTAEVQDLKRQLAAAIADVGIANSDTKRVMTANANLQSALESFTSEREAELSLLEEQQRSMEEAAAAAHAAALEATHEAHDAQIREIRNECDQRINQVMEQVHALERKNESLRLESVQMRRSLDEAIQRLQSTQEDVIDRTLMKNILLDWLTKRGAKERRQVLQVMANLLNFSEEEKEKVHVDEASIGSISRIVVGAVASPLPPPKADVEHLKGENVREKWVNFLMAETEN